MKDPIQCLINFLLVLVSLGCSSSGYNDVISPGLDSFSLKVGNTTYSAKIDKNEHSAIIGGIEYGADITAVSYVLTSGATISPDPQDLVGKWKNKEEQFTISSSNGESVIYKVILSDFVKYEPNEEKCDGMVIGYLLANDSEYDEKFKDIKWEYLTHVNVAFLRVTATGELLDNDVKDNIEEIRNKARENNVKVLISLRSDNNGNFTEAIKQEKNRTKLVNNTIKYVQDNELDGVDVDYEDYGKLGTDILAFAKELYEKKDKEILQTCAVVGWGLEMYTQEWKNYFDWINVMNYDHTGTWAQEGQHSAYDKSVNEIQDWITQLQTPASKLVLGLPFYGYTWDSEVFNNTPISVRYHQILHHYPTEDVANKDQVGRTYYNGQPTIRKKCRYAKEEVLAGVMIWQIFQDTADEKESLMNVIGEEFCCD